MTPKRHLSETENILPFFSSLYLLPAFFLSFSLSCSSSSVRHSVSRAKDDRVKKSGIGALAGHMAKTGKRESKQVLFSNVEKWLQSLLFSLCIFHLCLSHLLFSRVLSLSALLGPDDVPPPRYSPSRPFPWQLSRPLIAVETDREGSNEGGRATQIGSTLAMWSLYHSGFSLNVFYLPFFFFFFLTLSQYSPFHFRVSLFHSLLSLSPIFVFLLLSSFLSPHSLSLSFLCWHPSIICPSFQSSLFLSLLSVPITPHSCLLFSFSLLSLHSLSMTLFLSPAPSLCCCSMSSPVLSCTRQTYCRFVPIVLPAHSLLSWVSVFLDAVINPWLN